MKDNLAAMDKEIYEKNRKREELQGKMNAKLPSVNSMLIKKRQINQLLEKSLKDLKDKISTIHNATNQSKPLIESDLEMEEEKSDENDGMIKVRQVRRVYPADVKDSAVSLAW